MTTFSVIIPTFNRRQHLLECLSSVSAQRRRPDEVIVVDDGSNDGTVEALGDLQDVIVIHQANAGPGAARNRGAAAASGDYLVFLDSDDLWFPWSLEVLVRLVEMHARPVLLSARYEDFIGEISPPREEPAEGLAFPGFLGAASQALIVGAGMMVVDRNAFIGAGGFVEDRLNAEDHDLALRLGADRGFVQTIRPVTMGRRIHSGNETGDLEKTIRGVDRLVERERMGQYPGGAAWQDARRIVITRHVRPVVLQAIQAGNLRAAWQLYRRTLSWNARAGRAGFILGSPLLMLRAALWTLVSPKSAPSTR